MESERLESSLQPSSTSEGIRKRPVSVKTKDNVFPADETQVGKHVTYGEYKWPDQNGERIISVQYEQTGDENNENTIEFECRHMSNIRFKLRTKENENIASAISRVFRIPKKRLKLVAKAKIISPEDAATHARNGIPIYFVGSPVTEEQIAVRKQKKKEKKIFEAKKKAKKEEEKRLLDEKKKGEEKYIAEEMKKLEEQKKKVMEKQRLKEKGMCRTVMNFFKSLTSTRAMQIGNTIVGVSALFVTSLFSPVEGVGEETTEPERPQQPRYRREPLPRQQNQPDNEQKRPMGTIGGSGSNKNHNMPKFMRMGGGG